MKQSHVWKMQHPSQEFNSPPIIRVAKDRVWLGYDFETESGKYAFEEMTFEDAVAFSFTSSVQATIDQIDAYDTLLDVIGSPWLDQFQDETNSLHHFRIYFDDTGAFEVIAARFVTPG